MASFFKKKTAARSDNEKAGAYERDNSRLVQSSSQAARSHETGNGAFAPNPAFIRLLRFVLYSLTSLSALATAGLGLGVAHYYNTHRPVVYPAWGSLIAVIVFGIGTPGVLFGLFLVTPRLFRHGGVAGILNQVRIELVMLFNLSVFWISGALALACDLRGVEFCIWDGYYHYPKPKDFLNVCNLINKQVALAYTTFGLCAIQMVIIFSIVIYILLFLDQEVLTETTNDCGGRAYRARTAALQAHQTRVNAERNQVSTAGPNRSRVMSQAGPMAGGVASSRAVPTTRSNRPERYRDEERRSDDDEEEEEEDESNAAGNGQGYYGYETTGRV